MGSLDAATGRVYWIRALMDEAQALLIKLDY